MSKSNKLAMIPVLRDFRRLDKVLTKGKPTIPPAANRNIDLKELTGIGNKLKAVLYPEQPTMDTYSYRTHPLLPSRELPKFLLTNLTMKTSVAADTLANNGVAPQDNVFLRVGEALVREDIEPWEKEVWMVGKFSGLQVFYYVMLIGDDGLAVNKILAKMLEVAYPTSEGKTKGYPAARFTRQEQERFNATAERLKQVGIATGSNTTAGEPVESNFERLARLGEREGYFEGFSFTK